MKRRTAPGGAIRSAPGARLEAELVRLGAPRRRFDLAAVRPMLAEARDAPFTASGWLFEPKWDGYRALCAREGADARVRHRSGADATATWPEIARALRALPFERLLLDGEIVVLGEGGRPAFQRLQGRARLSRPADVERAAIADPATFLAFDLLALGDLDLRPLPLSARKKALRAVLPRDGPLHATDHVDERGEDLFRAARDVGLEGVMAKRADAPYREGRSGAWLKIRADRTGDFAVVGFTRPGGAGRVGLGALHLAVHDGTQLVYAGSVGTGFSDRELTELRARLEARRATAAPCAGAVPRGRQHVWVEPGICVEVRFLAWTEDGLVRQAVFVRTREDKRPEECVREGATSTST